MSSSLVEQCYPSVRSAIIDQDHPQSAKITRLHYSHPLVQLHRKFWLQSLQDVPENEARETGEGLGFILKLGIPGIWRSELLVRKEYTRLYEYCDKYLESRRNEQKPPSVVITGQPGIGMPVIWFRSTQRYLFVEEGVFVVSPDYPSTDIKARIWTLVDTDDSKDGIPDYLAPHETNYYIMFLSSVGSMATFN
ncbi:hypothetical protein EDB89DRAFT_2065396 [Lactarius sanguifluus]|nr:hypothetical protein EDB89DRAFT_2065396 [Lactarius sanguifluus]